MSRWAGDVASTYRLQEVTMSLCRVFDVVGDGSSISDILLAIKLSLSLLGLCEIHQGQLGRSPTEKETKAVREVLREHGVL